MSTPTETKSQLRGHSAFRTYQSGKSETTKYFYSMEKITLGNTTDNKTDSFSVESRDSSKDTGNNSSLRLFDSNKKAFNSLF